MAIRSHRHRYQRLSTDGRLTNERHRPLSIDLTDLSRDIEFTTLNPAQPRQWHVEAETVSTRLLRQLLGFNPFRTSYFTLFRPIQGFEARATAIAAVLLAIAAGLPLPIIGVIFSKIINKFPPPESELVTRVEELIGVGAAYFVVTAGYTICWGLTGERISRQLREQLVQRLLGLDQAYFDTEDPDVTNLLTDRIETVQIGTSEKVGIFIQSISYFVASFVVGFALNARLTGILFVVVIPTMAIIVTGGTRQVSRFSKRASEFSELACRIAEGAIASVKVVQAFDMSDKLAGQHYTLLRKAARFSLNKACAAATMLGAVYFTAYAANALAFYEGARIAADAGEGGAGTVYAVVFLILDASFVVGQFGPFLGAFGTAAAAGEKIFEVLDHDEPAINVYGRDGALATENTFREAIHIEQATFVYPSRNSTKALDGLDLTLKAGTMNAIVGQSGCGKSTLVSLLLRMYDVTSGCIRLGKHNIQSFNVASLRARIALVDQESDVFSGSVLENISHGLDKENLTPEECHARCVRAAEDANVNFLAALSDGIHTVIGQSGSTQLSGGQKQRICLARAIVSRPSLLLLDEPTSALDSTSEALVMQSVQQLAASGTTVVMVAHRLATVMDADHIVLMGAGKIIEHGTHAALIAQNGAYKAMVDVQGIGERAKDYESTLLKPKSIQRPSIVSVMNPSLEDEAASPAVAGDRQLSLTELIHRCLSLVGKDSPLVVLGLVASILSGGIIIGEAIVFGNLVQLLNRDSETSDFLSRADFFCLMFFVLAIVALFAHSSSGSAFGATSARFVAKIQHLSLVNILRQDMQWFQGRPVQSLLTNMQSETSQLTALTGVALGTVFTVTTSVLGGIILAHIVAWKIAIVLLSAVPVLVAAGYIRLRVLSLGETRHRSAYNDAAAVAAEACRSIRTVAALGRERGVYEEYKEALQQPYQKGLRFMLLSNVLLALSLSITYFVYALAYWWGAKQVRNGDYNELQFFIVLPALLYSAQSAGQVFSLSPEISRAHIAARKVFALHDQRPTIMTDDSTGQTSLVVENSSSRTPLLNSDIAEKGLQRDAGHIELQEVSLKYATKSDHQALRGVSLDIRPGEFVALVGPSGAGKSSLISLLERFYDPTAGKIIMDGEDIRDVPVRDHRARIGLVPQDPDLFPGSITYNICLGAAPGQDITEDEVVRICKSCGIHDFIMSLPEAYNTECGTNGSKLSGGQKQRVAIARALVRKPKLLLLDEYTSALDAHSEQQIKGAVASAAVGRTTLAVAHRLSTVQHADRIFVFDHGRLVEEGNHAELVAKGGVYAVMVNAQMLT